MMGWGYDALIIPYIDGTLGSAKLVVFDHGYNDRGAAMASELSNIGTADFTIAKADSNFDRSTYIGAFCFLVKKIWEVDPTIKIAIYSYLENQTGGVYPSDPQGKYGYVICSLQKAIANHFNFPFMPVYEKSRTNVGIYSGNIVIYCRLQRSTWNNVHNTELHRKGKCKRKHIVISTVLPGRYPPTY